MSRSLIYIEPDPAPDRSPPLDKRPGVFENLLAGLVTLPRAEPIRQDIADLEDRNAAVQRLREIERDAERAAFTSDGPPATAPDPSAPFAALRTAYLALRRRTVIDQMIATVAALDCDAAADERATRLPEVLRGWPGDVGARDLEGRLDELDTSLCHRRLSFLQDRATELLLGGDRAQELLRLAGHPAGAQIDADALRTFKRELNRAALGLRQAERAPYARQVPDEPDPTLPDRVERARRAVSDGGNPDAIVAAIEELLMAPIGEFRRGVAGALADGALTEAVKETLSACDERFALIDMVVLPLAYPDLGEVNAVTVRRISPRDAPAIAPARPAKAEEKLAGIRLRSFGAFLERDWRVNDLLWGRLDAVEGLLAAVLPKPDEEDLRESFRVRAQAAILREAELPGNLAVTLKAQRDDSGPHADRELVEAFRAAYKARPRLSSARQDELARDTVAVARTVLAAERQNPSTRSRRGSCVRPAAPRCRTSRSDSGAAASGDASGAAPLCRGDSGRARRARAAGRAAARARPPGRQGPTSTTRTVPWSPAIATRRPSSARATARMRPSPVEHERSRRSRTPTTRAVPSSPAVATKPASGASAIARRPACATWSSSRPSVRSRTCTPSAAPDAPSR